MNPLVSAISEGEMFTWAMLACVYLAMLVIHEMVK
jgi:hypothetical protein